MKYIRDIESGERVRVHRNLNNGRMSVLSWNNNHDDKARVIAHVDNIFLTDCKFIVQPAGSRKAKETNERNVHAFIEGNVSNPVNDIDWDGRVTYHPFKLDNFILINNRNKKQKINECEYVSIKDGRHVYAKL